MSFILPPIGSKFQDGIYAGNMKQHNILYAIIIFNKTKKLPFFSVNIEYDDFPTTNSSGIINQTNFINKYKPTNLYNKFEAFQYCINLKTEYSHNWYLPSKNELKIIYNNLNSKNLIPKTPRKYWSSTVDRYSNNFIYTLSFNNETARQIAELKLELIDVLPIRRLTLQTMDTKE